MSDLQKKLAQAKQKAAKKQHQDRMADRKAVANLNKRIRKAKDQSK